MKAHYDKDEDILMLVLSNKKIDDAYDTENGIVEVAEDGEPVILTIFKASKLLKNLGRVIPTNLQREFWPIQTSTAISHRVR